MAQQKKALLTEPRGLCDQQLRFIACQIKEMTTPVASKIQLRHEDILDEAHMSEAIVTYLQSSGIHDVQRYHSGLRRFASADVLTFSSGFKAKYHCISSQPEKTENPRIWTGQWISGEVTRTLRVFSKIIHLVDPILFQQRSQILSYVPAPDSEQRDELRRHALSRHNQASVDATVCYILSRIGELGATPHAIQYLETICGIANEYEYKITDDYMSFRNQRWFWSMAEGGSKLTISGSVPDDITEWIRTPPKEESIAGMEESESFASGFGAPIEVNLDAEQIQSIEAAAATPCELVELVDFTIGPAEGENADEATELFRFDSGSCKAADAGDEAMDCLEAVDGDIFLKCSNIPVLICFQEAADGTMDELLKEFDLPEDVASEDMSSDKPCDIIDNEEAEERWSAWIFQVVAALSVFQKYVRFCHNDLHTNNIVWFKTDEPYLYYKNENGEYYKVPTYGKLFKIIDFGRATCEIGEKKIMSSDFAPGQDAAGQYNWGPFYNDGLPEVAPNMSFDLCRLAISLFESLCVDEEQRYDSPLASLLWKWMLDDNGESVLYNDIGEERFPGFELYIHISAAVHGAVPAEQFTEKPFSRFKWKGKAMKAGASKVRAYPIYTWLSDIDEELRK